MSTPHIKTRMRTPLRTEILCVSHKFININGVNSSNERCIELNRMNDVTCKDEQIKHFESIDVLCESLKMISDSTIFTMTTTTTAIHFLFPLLITHRRRRLHLAVMHEMCCPIKIPRRAILIRRIWTEYVYVIWLRVFGIKIQSSPIGC